eukprot:COSAG01_NODE_514_length_16043_cov_248.614212_4_plen_111_part_00
MSRLHLADALMRKPTGTRAATGHRPMSLGEARIRMHTDPCPRCVMQHATSSLPTDRTVAGMAGRLHCCTATWLWACWLLACDARDGACMLPAALRALQLFNLVRHAAQLQ